MVILIFFLYILVRGNKSQYLHLAKTKGKVDAAQTLLDDLQLEEGDTDSPRYIAIAAIKDELTGADDLIKGRLDLIQKVDASKTGWSAAPHYEKTNGLLLKDDSGKNWEEAEKKVAEIKKTAVKEYRESYQQPFRVGPASRGRFQNQRTSRGIF